MQKVTVEIDTTKFLNQNQKRLLSFMFNGYTKEEICKAMSLANGTYNKMIEKISETLGVDL